LSFDTYRWKGKIQHQGCSILVHGERNNVDVHGILFATLSIDVDMEEGFSLLDCWRPFIWHCTTTATTVVTEMTQQMTAAPHHSRGRFLV
jgi:hypothetical protein